MPEMILSSGDEEAIASNKTDLYGSGSVGGGGRDYYSGRASYSSGYSDGRRRDSQTDLPGRGGGGRGGGGDDDESEEDESDDEDADYAN